MGGLETVAAVAKTGLDAKSLMDKRQADQQAQNNLKLQYANNIANQRNLLDQQLAARRAKVGAMGISSDGSSTAVQQGQIQDFNRQVLMEGAQTDAAIREKKLQSRLSTNAGLSNLLSDFKQIK